jgi:hypothetical protein
MAESIEAVEVNRDTGKFYLTKTKIDVYDMYSEGETGGLVTGTYTYVGTLGNIGWTSATFTPYAGSSDNVRKCRSIFWNDVPVVNDNGQFNFQSVDFTDTPGYPNGAIIGNDYGGKTSYARSVGERLRQTQRDAAKVITIDERKRYRIMNVNCTEAYVNIRVVQLSITEDDTTGDLVQNEMEISFFYRPIYKDTQNIAFKFASSVHLRGKITQGYIHSEKITFSENRELSKNLIGWEVMVERSTKESYDSNFRAVTFVDSLIEIYDKVFTYPDCAIIRQKFDAEFFQQIPNRAFHVDLLKVQVPITYDPISRTYNEPRGYWDGTFKANTQWTDNPAWCFYDLLTNKRYGLGKYLSNINVDKFNLYEIGKYCDTLVSDGYGGLEPRFTANVYFTTRETAFNVVNDMASIFNALTYYGNGRINVIQDSPKEPMYQFTNDNVENGEFNYSSSAKKARHTIAIVRYNDPTNYFRPAVEYVEDVDAIRRYGIRELDLTAFGCASRGQAVRLGRWALLSESLLTETVNFTAGTEGAYLRPGDVFQIYDKYRKSVKNAGRILKHEINETGSLLWLDSNTTLDSNVTYKLSLLTPSHDYNHSELDDFNSSFFSGIRNSFIQKKTFLGSSAQTGISGTRIQFNTSFDTENFLVDRYQVYAIELGSGSYYLDDHQSLVNPSYDYYRVINVEETDTYRFKVVALQYSDQKFLEIESGLNFERPTTITQIRPTSPSDINMYLEDTRRSKVVNYNLTINDYSGVTSFRIFGKTGDFDSNEVPNNEFIISDLAPTKTFDKYVPQSTGIYFFRAYGYNDESQLYSTKYVSGRISVNTSVEPVLDTIISSLTIRDFTGQFETPNYISSIRTTNLNPVFTWQVGTNEDIRQSNEFGYRVTVRAPSNTSIPSNVLYYEVLNDTETNLNQSWEFPFSLNNSSELQALGGPFRKYDVVVEAISSGGYTSAGNFTNPTIIENGWESNPNGYDIININNLPISGINLSSGNVHPTNYRTNQFIDINTDFFCSITGGIVPQDCVGGWVFISRNPFSGLDVITGKIGISKTEFSWDVVSEHIYAPRAAYDLRYKSGYAAVSFYDEFDYAHWHPTMYTGLYISNCVPVIVTGDLGITSMFYSDGTTAKIETRVVNGSERTVIVYNNGQEIVV